MGRLRTQELYRDEQSKIVAIEALEINQHKFGNGRLLYASLTPIALVVCTRTGSEVLAVAVDDHELGTIKQRHPEWDELLVTTCR